MENQRSIDAVRAAVYDDDFTRPLYDTYCFYQLPQTILHLLGHDPLQGLPVDVLPDHRTSYDTVILFFIDAFGWRFFSEHASRHPFLQHFLNSGVASLLTSQFPSTTAAHVTTIHTGMAPAQSGVYEWLQYQPSLNAIVTPLMFSLAGDMTRDALSNEGITASDIFPTHSIYEILAARRVASHVFQSNAFANSVASRHLLAGSEIVPFKTFPEALVQLGKRLSTQTVPSYYLLYFSNIDSLCHEYGPVSAEVEAEIDSLMITMERLLLDRLSGKYPRTLLLMTADHGMTEINPATTIYLNRESGLEQLRSHLIVNRIGNPLVPAGSSRDLFLHIKPEALDDMHALLDRTLKNRMRVIRTSELISAGLFGPRQQSISSVFLERVGNLALLPYREESVYWYEQGRFEQKFYGHHGGMTRNEMEIPLLACNL